jgi:hypothetical protein
MSVRPLCGFGYVYRWGHTSPVVLGLYMCTGKKVNDLY